MPITSTPRTTHPFDAVLVIAFGGPEGPDDVRPFLANVLRGRQVPAGRVEEVARHYEHFGGVSPLTAITRRQAGGLRDRLASRGVDLPVYLGMRNWHPLLPDTLSAMARDGVRRAVGFVCAAHRSYSSCTQYRENVADAQRMVVAAGLPRVDVTYVGDWHLHTGFIDAVARRIVDARARLPGRAAEVATLVFTAHSIPVRMPGADRYQQQLRESVEAVVASLGGADHALVYQSRSGRPSDPWLEPDVCEYLRAARRRGLEAVVLCPIGFLCDHIEVLYDLDYEAAAVASEEGIAVVRAAAVNDDPAFLDLMADQVMATMGRYERGVPVAFAAPLPAVASRP